MAFGVEILCSSKGWSPADAVLNRRTGATPTMDFRIDLVQVVHALADALDLVGIDEVAHGKRVGYMAFKTAEAAGFAKGP